MNTLTQCTRCGAAVPAGAFCAICGFQMTAESPATTSAKHSAPPPAKVPVVHVPAQSDPNADPGHPLEPAAFPAAGQHRQPSAQREIHPAEALGLRIPAPTNPPFEAAVPPAAMQEPTHTVPSAPSEPVLAETPAPPPLELWTARVVHASNRSKSIATVVVLLIAAFLVFGRGESHTVTGDLTLYDLDISSDAGDSCSGEGGYDDIGQGSEVVVENEAGTTLATGELEDGTHDGLGCVFTFEVPDVGKAKFYRVMIGNESRGGLRFSHEQMSENDWSAHLTLGL